MIKINVTDSAENIIPKCGDVFRDEEGDVYMIIWLEESQMYGVYTLCGHDDAVHTSFENIYQIADYYRPVAVAKNVTMNIEF